jgi:glycosyltransferase involved in cell wall biosynthesis
LHERLSRSMDGTGKSYEIIYVDDGSTDTSPDFLKALFNVDPHVVVIRFRRNFGKAAALSCGFEAARGDVIVSIDADLQDDPDEIPNFLAKLDEGYDLVSGWKAKRRDSWFKVASSRFFNWVVRIASGVRLHDFNCGFKAYRREVVKEVEIYGDLHRYIPFLAAARGFKVGEIKVKHHARKHGHSKYGWDRYLKGFLDLLTATVITRFSRKPLHLFGGFGVLCLIVGFVILAYLTVIWFLTHAIGGRPLLQLGMLLMILGIQLISIGLIGEMIIFYRPRGGREYPTAYVLSHYEDDGKV